MACCYVPFNGRNLDISFYVLRPTVIYVDDLVEALKQFSMYTENLGCVHSSIFRSIHGNMIIWYGAWMKRSQDKKQILGDALISVLSNYVSSMAVVLDHSFFDAYAGESKDGSPAAKFFTGDIISLSSATLSPKDLHSDQNDVTQACLAIFKDRFKKMDGARAGVCFQSQTKPRVVALFSWKSLQFCYSYILKSDYRKAILPYLNGIALHIQYDVFRVVDVSGDNALTALPSIYPRKNEAYTFAQDFHGR